MKLYVNRNELLSYKEIIKDKYKEGYKGELRCFSNCEIKTKSELEQEKIKYKELRKKWVNGTFKIYKLYWKNGEISYTDYLQKVVFYN